MRWAVVICTLAAACSREPEPPAAPARDPLPDAALHMISDRGMVAADAQRLSSFRGKPVVLDVWATWCPPCREVLPLVEEEVGRLGDGEVELVSVCMDGIDKPAAARDMLRELAPRTALFADDGTYAEALGVTEIPHVVVVDRKGGIVGQLPYGGTDKLRAFLATAVPAARAR
jgi:thiol-disulfide isomerase/thioredoxin